MLYPNIVDFILYPVIIAAQADNQPVTCRTIPVFLGVYNMDVQSNVSSIMAAQDAPLITDGIAEEAAARMNTLTKARAACVTGIKDGDGLIVTYARAISLVCGEGWVHLVGKESATVKEERKLFDRAMGVPEEVLTVYDKKLKAKCNSYWKRIRDEAGYVKDEKVTTVLTIDAKNLAELKTMINRILNEESESDTCPLSSEAKGNLIDAFETLGGDQSTLGKKA
jgi:hypothetical protein